MEEENKEEEKENTHNAGAGNREEELQKVIYQAKALEEHANTLDNQIAMLNGTFQEMQRTIET
ncbi:MAG: hypothetical protein CVT89_08610, partial [Candidatus Altiarchaeales archaeon HGW-Altiarchaeales-2]